MIFLILAILTSALVSLFMRLSGDKITHKTGLLAVSYLVSTGLAALHTDPAGFTGPGLGLAAAMGLVNGALYLMNLVLMQRNIEKSGVVLTSTFTRLGLVVVVALSVLLFREYPTGLQLAGMALALGAILLSRGQAEGGRFQPELLLCLAGAGVGDAWVKAYGAWGREALSDQFLLLTFGAAAGLCLIIMKAQGQRIGKWELAFGAAVAVPNYYNSRFLLAALQEVPAIILYPTYQVAALLTVTVVGVCLFRERLSRRQWTAMALILAALALLNL